MAKSGPMDQKITLRKLTRTADGGGGVIETWSDFATDPNVWARVSFKGGREGMDEGRINASQMTTFEIYTRSDVSEIDGIIWAGEFYNIRTVRRYGQRQLTMWIDAERGVAN